MKNIPYPNGRLEYAVGTSTSDSACEAPSFRLNKNSLFPISFIAQRRLRDHGVVTCTYSPTWGAAIPSGSLNAAIYIVEEHCKQDMIVFSAFVSDALRVANEHPDIDISLLRLQVDFESGLPNWGTALLKYEDKSAKVDMDKAVYAQIISLIG